MITVIHYLIHRKPFTSPPERAHTSDRQIIEAVYNLCGNVERMELPKYFPNLGITIFGYEKPIG